MSIKNLLGLSEVEISDSEIVKRIQDADNQNLDEINFMKADGSVIKVKIPQIGFDPQLFKDR